MDLKGLGGPKKAHGRARALDKGTKVRSVCLDLVRFGNVRLGLFYKNKFCHKWFFSERRSNFENKQ